jgi:hypothetical protein
MRRSGRAAIGAPLNGTLAAKNMAHPLEVAGARLCVLRHPDETVICANIEGFKALGAWMTWLAESKPEEFFHVHLLWHLESEASKFDDLRPKNVWVLNTPDGHRVKAEIPEGAKAVPFEVTFQVITEPSLDELAAAQDSGLIPPKYLKTDVSIEADCG